MARPIGGRGKKAAYDTKVLRVPLPVFPLVESILDIFYKDYADGDPLTEDSKQTWSVCHVEKKEAIAIATDLVRQKQSASSTVSKLLRLLYLDNSIVIRSSRPVSSVSKDSD